MLSDNETLRILYLQLTVMGFLGNCFLLVLYRFDFIPGNRTKPIKIIIIHLASTNIMLILFRGIPIIPRVWGIKCFLDGLGMRIITSLQSLSRGLSLGTTCLLTTFQAITLTHNSSILTELKNRARKWIISCVLLTWIINVLVNIAVFTYDIGSKNSTESKHGCNIGYRALNLYDTNHLAIMIGTFVRDTVFVCLMACSSGYMVFILYRHNQKIKHIQSNILCQKKKSFHEIRATKTILLLVVMFVFLNAPSPIFVLCMFYFKETSTWAIHASVLLSLCYPAVNPFILMSIDTRMSKVCCVH